jgi:hypothetical protein
MKPTPGETVIVILHSPRERLFGILDEITTAGIYLHGIEIGYFDDWCSSIASGEEYLPMSDYFLPMWRVERLTRDSGPDSLAAQFLHRTGREINEF